VGKEVVSKGGCLMQGLCPIQWMASRYCAGPAPRRSSLQGLAVDNYIAIVIAEVAVDGGR